MRECNIFCLKVSTTSSMVSLETLKKIGKYMQIISQYNAIYPLIHVLSTIFFYILLTRHLKLPYIGCMCMCKVVILLNKI